MPINPLLIKALQWIGGLIAVLILLSNLISFNHQGYRQVVQTGSGSIKCVFTAGPYLDWFGSSIQFNDAITYDFDKSPPDPAVKDASVPNSLEQMGIKVRYRDGGIGTIYGKARFGLPSDCPSMMLIAREFRSNDGLAQKLIGPITQEVANQTAGLMTSEESYAEKRSVFSQWFNDQLALGKYITRTDEIVTAEAGYEHCLDKSLLTDEQNGECSKVRRTRERIPVIDSTNPNPHQESALKRYGIMVLTSPLGSPDYEKSTLDQISKKREATMGIITARANAERSKADALAAEQNGKAKVVEAQYEKETIKAQAIVDAERLNEVAVINAKQLVQVAEQKARENEQKAKAAEFYRIEQTKIGEGEAAKKKAILDADGGLAQRLTVYENVMTAGFKELGAQKWVPEIQMGGATTGTGANNIESFMQMLNAKTAKDLALDMSMERK